MPIDPSIALQVRPIEVPNQLGQLAQASQIMAAQRQGEVAQMQLEQLKQDRDEMQKLQQELAAKGGNPDLRALAAMLIKSPKHVEKGIELLQKLDEQDKYAEYLKKFSPGAAAAPAAAPAPAVSGALGSGTFGVTPALTNALAAAPAAAPAAPVNQLADLESRYRTVAAINTPGAKAEAELLKSQIVEANKQPADVATMRSLGYPLTKEGYAAFRDAQRQERLLSPEEEAQRIRIAHASRQPQQPTAPTVTSIIDPTDPNKMITIDARRYQGGGVGSPGVLGVAGKEPGAALRINKIEEGKTQLQNDLDNLRSAFTELDRLRAIPSTGRGTISNLMSAAQATGVGQALGRAGGTKEQVERDVINSARQRLVASIKNATGMSSKSLDSNMELQTMLRSISDPGQSVEAAMRIIGDIEDAYVKGGGMQKKGTPAPTPTSAPGASAPSVSNW